MQVEQTRAFFQRNLENAIRDETNAQGTLEAYRKKEAEARKLGNYEAQLQVYTNDLAAVSERVKRLTDDLERFDRETAEREQQEAQAREDAQAWQVIRPWMRGVQLVMESGSEEEKATLKRLLGQKK